MVQILVTADSIQELYSKTLKELGLIMGQQPQLPGFEASPIAPQATTPAAPAPAAKQEEPKSNVTELPKRARRTKTEVEAERQTKNGTAKTAKEKIENNFQAADELDEEIESPAEADLVGEAEVEVAAVADAAPKTLAQASDVMKKLLSKVTTPEALALLQKHGIKKLSEAASDTTLLGQWVHDAEALIASKSK